MTVQEIYLAALNAPTVKKWARAVARLSHYADDGDTEARRALELLYSTERPRLLEFEKGIQNGKENK